MLTDRVPFDSSDANYLKRQRSTHSPLPPFILSTGVAPAVSDIVMDLLERDPAKRPCRAELLQAGLADALSANAEAAATNSGNLTMKAAR